MGAKATHAKGHPRSTATPVRRGTREKNLLSKMVIAVHSSRRVAAVVVGSSETWWLKWTLCYWLQVFKKGIEGDLNMPGDVAMNATVR
jgi:hypothetical protein